MADKELYICSPLVESEYLSESAKPLRVWLKLENCQPSNSFKVRGLGAACKKALSEGHRGVVTFSGGNAGISLAYIASKLKLNCQVCVPRFVSRRVTERMKFFGATIHVSATGREAYNHSLDLVQKDPTLAYIHPHNNPAVWDGYAKMVHEVKEQLGEVKPCCFVVSVGGGGLLMGILRGLEDLGWNDIPVIAMETIGADSFNKTLATGEIVENHLTSIAKTLGAPSVTPFLLEALPNFNVASATLPDIDAVRACLKFADHHGFLVEPACGVSLAAAYEGLIPEILKENGFNVSLESGPAVIIVCGGNDANVEIMNDYAVQVGLPIDV